MPVGSSAILRSGRYSSPFETSYPFSSLQDIGSKRESISRSSRPLSDIYSSACGEYARCKTSRVLPSMPGPLDYKGTKLVPHTLSTPARLSHRAGAYMPPSSIRSSRFFEVGRSNADQRDCGCYVMTSSDCSRNVQKFSIVDRFTPPIIRSPVSVDSANGMESGRRRILLAPLETISNQADPMSSHRIEDHVLKSRLKAYDMIHDGSDNRSSNALNQQVVAGRRGEPSSSCAVHKHLSDSKEPVVVDIRLPASCRSSGTDVSHAVLRNADVAAALARSDVDTAGSSLSSSSARADGIIDHKHRSRGTLGLCNLGNTCFMNSVLQCLANTKLLVEWCVSDKYLDDLRAAVTTSSSTKGMLVRAFAGLIKSMWGESSELHVSPNAFKTQIQKFAPRFVGYLQQDAQEFLLYLLEGVHEDVNRVTRKPKAIILDDKLLIGKSDAEKAKEYWLAYLHRDDSRMVDIFVGQLRSELKFTKCGHRSVTFDPFWDLSIPIPKNCMDVTLDDCLKLFMKEEVLEALERPICSKCHVRQSCMKSFAIHRFPHILIIHLKRFSQERYGRKLNTRVDFPLKGLKLSNYSSSKDGVGGGQPAVTYDLYAVCNHSGGVHSGHYTAVSKNAYSGEWNNFNDIRVSQAQPSQAVSSEAYILFYEQASPACRL